MDYITKELVQDMLVRHEGKRNKPYHCPSGKLTIGIGRNIEERGISDAEAFFMLDNDINRVVNELHQFPFFASLWLEKQQVTSSRVRCAAMIDMCFNLGITKFKRFRRMLAAMERKDYGAAADHAKDSRWFRQVGRRGHAVVYMIRTGDIYDYF